MSIVVSLCDLTGTFVRSWAQDQEDGSISYEVWDTNPDSYRRVCSLNDSELNEGRNAKRDAYAIAAASACATPDWEKRWLGGLPAERNPYSD